MSLETCDDGHEQIVYECSGRGKCPVCQLIKDNEAAAGDYAKKIDELQEEVNSYEDDVERLEARVAELEEQLPEQGPIKDPRCQRAIPNLKPTDGGIPK